MTKKFYLMYRKYP